MKERHSPDELTESQKTPILVWFREASVEYSCISPVLFAKTEIGRVELFTTSHWLELGALEVTYVATTCPGVVVELDGWPEGWERRKALIKTSVVTDAASAIA